MPPLEFLAPLAAAGAAASAAFAAVTSFLIVAALGAPLVSVLAKTPMPRGLWRWPVFWVVVPVSSLFVTAEAVRDRSQSLLPLGALCAWLMLSLFVGVPRLAFRVLRFAFTGKNAAGASVIDRLLGVFGLIAATVGFAGALSTSPGVLGLSFLVAALSLNFFRDTSVLPHPERRAHGVWVFGTLLIALCAPVVLTGAVIISQEGMRAVVSGGGIPKGMVLTIAAAMGVVVGVVAVRFRAAPSQLSAQS